MIELKERFLVDAKGDRVGVFLDMEVYRKLLELIEEIESIRAYDAAQKANDKAILFEQAIAEIEAKRK